MASLRLLVQLKGSDAAPTSKLVWALSRLPAPLQPLLAPQPLRTAARARVAAPGARPKPIW